MAEKSTRPVTKREEAKQLLLDLFAAQDRVLISEAMEKATAQGISRSVMYRTRRDLGVRTILNGRHSGIWAKPAAGRKT